MNINNGPNGLSLLLRDENLWEMQGKEPGRTLIDSDGQFGEERTNSYGWFQFLARDQTSPEFFQQIWIY